LEGEEGKWRREVDKWRGKCRRRESSITRLEHEIAGIQRSRQEAVEAQVRQTRAAQEQLKQTKELLDARTAELSGAQTFLSTADRLSEMEVLSIVRDLNEKIYQVAVSLTEGWEKLEPPQATGQMEVDPAPQPHVLVLIQLARKRDLTGLTYLIQSFLCYQVMTMTSSWTYNRDLGVLKHVYQKLSASEGQAISARWRSLTHSHLSPPAPQSASMMEQLAGILEETGSFPSPQQSLEFVQTVGVERIESMIQTAQRLETAFMIDVTSSDMSLLYENPETMFDDAKMINEFGSDSAYKPGKRDKIAGTTEVGVKKIAYGGPGEAPQVGILLKPKVVLERDVVGDGK